MILCEEIRDVLTSLFFHTDIQVARFSLVLILPARVAGAAAAALVHGMISEIGAVATLHFSSYSFKHVRYAQIPPAAR